MPAKDYFDAKVLENYCNSSMAGFKKLGQVGGPEDNFYVFLDYKSPILGVAHLDTVIFDTAFSFDEKTQIVKSPQLDDRLGAYMLCHLLRKMHLTFDILLTTGEETGHTSARLYKPPADKKYNWIFSFDRRGTDVVMYSYEETFYDKLLGLFDFTLATGSFSCIESMQSLACRGFNFGTGYYENHLKTSYAKMDEAFQMADKFALFFHAFKHINLPHTPVETKKTYSYPVTPPASQSYSNRHQHYLTSPTSYFPNKKRIDWAVWKKKPWVCNCKEGENTRQASQKKCKKCRALRSDWIKDQFAKEEKIQKYDIQYWPIDLQNSFSTSLQNLCFAEHELEKYTLCRRAAEELSMIYDEKTAETLLLDVNTWRLYLPPGNYLILDDVLDVLTADYYQYEIVDYALDPHGWQVFQQVSELLTRRMDEREFPIDTTRKLIAVMSYDAIDVFCDMLENMRGVANLSKAEVLDIANRIVLDSSPGYTSEDENETISDDVATTETPVGGTGSVSSGNGDWAGQQVLSGSGPNDPRAN